MSDPEAETEAHRRPGPFPGSENVSWPNSRICLEWVGSLEERRTQGGSSLAGKTSNSTKEKLVVGWREIAALPDWRIPSILAKIDTGARTSALHVEHLVELDDGRLRFDVVIHEQPGRKVKTVEAQAVRWSKVRPSSGERQVRPVIRTRLRLGDWEREVEVSLVQRRGMLCRMLIGRTAMHGLVVDPKRRYLVSQAPSPTKHPRTPPTMPPHTELS